MAVKGTWNILGFNLPDFGATESAGASPSNTSFYNPNVFSGQGTTLMPRTLSSYNTQVGGRATTQAHLDPTKGGTIPMDQVLGAKDNTLSGGGGGGGNPNYDEVKGALEGENDAYLSGLRGTFDHQAEQLKSQLGFADQNKRNALDTLSGQEVDLRNRTAQEETRSKGAVEDAIGEAGATAKNVQRENRNILRALGILSSSAGAEMLGKPLNEFDKERARLGRMGMERVTQLRDYMESGLREIGNARNQIETQYGQLVSQIQGDLRFNEFQRAQAIMDANAALKSKMAELKVATAQITQQVSSAQNQVMEAIQKQAGLALPQGQTGGITAMRIDPQAQGRTQASIYGQPKDDERLSSLYQA